MIQRKFYIQISIRLLLITLTCLAFAIAISNLKDDYLFVSLNLILLIILQVFLLIRYSNKTNKDLSNFFQAILNDDYSVVFNQKRKKDSVELQSFLDKINGLIQEKTLNVEKQKKYLEYAFEKANVGLLSFDESGVVDIYNQHAQELLKINNIKEIKDLNEPYPELYSLIKNLTPETGNSTLKLIVPSLQHNDIKETIVLAVNKSIFTINEKKIHLVSFTNIKNELDNKEMDSWQKLIRVLTHEIMNSVSPIPALTQNIKKAYTDTNTGENKDITNIKVKDIETTLRGINTIEQSSNSLLHFVKQYRNLTLLLQPNFSTFELKELFNHIATLFSTDLKRINYRIELKPDNLIIKADRGMIEQVFINLFKNSIAAVQKSELKEINIEAFPQSSNRVYIKFSDTGIGFNRDIAEKIFIPFFTTKEEGSGIGLSLSKQIIHLHKGEIDVQSEEGVGTSFTILL